MVITQSCREGSRHYPACVILNTNLNVWNRDLKVSIALFNSEVCIQSDSGGKVDVLGGSGIGH